MWRELLNYGDGQGWVHVYLLARGICKAIRWPAAPVWFPLEPGVQHRMTTAQTGQHFGEKCSSDWKTSFRGHLCVVFMGNLLSRKLQP